MRKWEFRAIHRFSPAAMLIALAVFWMGCGGGGTTSTSETHADPVVNFAVITNPHLYDKSRLGSDSPELNQVIMSDHDMLLQSEEILDTALLDLQHSSIDFLVVDGDITAAGERINHELLADKLIDFKRSGKKVFVLPGNHDVLDPMARSYMVSPPEAVPSVTPQEFRTIYHDLGFADATQSDSDSLSYLAEPVPGLWILCLDACRYQENGDTVLDSGKLQDSTLAWAENWLDEARRQDKQVIGFMHHAILEIFPGQDHYFPQAVVQDHAQIAERLAAHGLSTLFTGHWHGNDVSSGTFGGRSLYQIQTGPLATAPSAYRMASLNLRNLKLNLETRHVVRIPSHPQDFVEFSTDLLRRQMTGMTLAELQGAPFRLDAQTAGEITPLVVKAFTANYAGDETLPEEEKPALEEMSRSADPRIIAIGGLITALWTDSSPADNNLTLKLPE